MATLTQDELTDVLHGFELAQNWLCEFLDSNDLLDADRESLCKIDAALDILRSKAAKVPSENPVE